MQDTELTRHSCGWLYEDIGWGTQPGSCLHCECNPPWATLRQSNVNMSEDLSEEQSRVIIQCPQQRDMIQSEVSLQGHER